MIRDTSEPDVVALDVDQADLALNPTRTRVWAPVGVPWEVETPGNNRKQAIFGAVNSRTGQTHFALTPHKRSADFQEFVEHKILSAYPDAKLVCLIVDGASIYQSKSTQSWLAQHPQVSLVFLPTYAPTLNLQEQIWRWLRQMVTHNHYFRSFALLLAAADHFFAHVADRPSEVLQRIGRAPEPPAEDLAEAA